MKADFLILFVFVFLTESLLMLAGIPGSLFIATTGISFCLILFVVFKKQTDIQLVVSETYRERYVWKQKNKVLYIILSLIVVALATPILIPDVTAVVNPSPVLFKK